MTTIEFELESQREGLVLTQVLLVSTSTGSVGV